MSKIGVRIWRHVFESGDEKRIAQQHPDISMLQLQKDIPYIEDGERGHLLDIYRRKDGNDSDPLMINIHGGGLFASYKEVNAHFNYEIAKRGYTVVSISYRRIPETTLRHQIGDVMHALCWVKGHAEEYHLNINDLYLSGDSAGALLSLFALSLETNPILQSIFKIQGSDLHFKAAAMISIMLDTQRKDLMMAISNVITDKEDKGKTYVRFLKDPGSLVKEAKLPPIIQFTSEEDLIHKDSLKFEALLTQYGVPHEIHDRPKGEERELVHVYPVMYPDYPESQEVYALIDAFFRKEVHNGE